MGKTSPCLLTSKYTSTPTFTTTPTWTSSYIFQMIDEFLKGNNSPGTSLQKKGGGKVKKSF